MNGILKLIALILAALAFFTPVLNCAGCSRDGTDGNVGSVVEKGNGGETVDLPAIINENSDLPVAYMSLSPDYDSEEMEALTQTYEMIHNFMSNDYYGDDLAFFYYGYPNDESPYHLAKIVLYTERYHILGVTIGSDIRQAVETLRSYGFEGTSQFDEIFSYAELSCGDFTIEMTARDGYAVTGFELSAASVYLGNRIY